MTDSGNESSKDSCKEALIYVSEYLHRIGSITLVVQLADSYQPVLIRFPAKVSHKLEFVFRHTDNNARMLSREINLPVEFGSPFAGTERPLDELNSSQTIQLSIKASATTAKKDRPNQISFLNDSQLSTPWSTNYLSTFNSSSSEFSCLHCGNQLLSCQQINTWKSLPSETWAEMMDFWHCHKPSDPTEKSSSFNPSYTVSSFHAYPSTALVGLSYILFHPSHFISSDSYTVKTDVSGAKYPVVCCAKCSTWLGFLESSDTFKIYKWGLALHSQVQKPLEYPGYLYVSATIEELIGSHGIYTFSLSPEDYLNEKQEIQASDSEVALIWIFNPDIRYCTNMTMSGNVDRGFKVFYSSDSAVIPSLKKARGDIEQLYFPKKIINNLLQHLKKNAELYPKESPNIGKGWTVSILNRL